jgi:thiol:disulfide interchange protein DsbD
MSSTLRNLLPKPGTWMVVFKQILAFPMFMSVAWLIWVYGQQDHGMYGVMMPLMGLILLAFAIWLYKISQPKIFAGQKEKKSVWQIIGYGLAILSVVMALSFLVFTQHHQAKNSDKASDPTSETSQETTDQQQELHGPHIAFSPEALSVALAGLYPTKRCAI